MTIRHLKVFVSVCENGSITKTAEQMCTAQPAISQTIADMEKYYGIILFNRINQRLKLTEDGKILYLKAKEVINGFEDFESSASSVADSPKLNIGVSLTFGKNFLPKLMKMVKENYPQVRLFTYINNSKEIQEEILEGRLDFAVIEGKPTYPNIKAEDFKSDKLMVVCGYNYDYPEFVTINELSKTTLLLREKGSTSRDYLENILRLHDLSCFPSMESISNQAIISAVTQNLGVAVLPEELVKSYISRKKLKEIKLKDFDLIRNSYVISHKNKTFGKVVKSIYDTVLKGFDF